MPTVLVTGAGRGIGEAVATRLAAAGWRVHAGVRDEASAGRLRAAHDLLLPLPLDITDADQVHALDALLPDRLDAVVNNAGIGVLGPLETVSAADLRRQLEVNVVGTLAVTQAVLPRLRASAGRVVLVSSTGGRVPVPMEGAYCASKFALEGMADVLRVELRPWRIAVSVVEPGPTDTGPWREIDRMLDDMEAGMTTEQRELYARHTAGMRRLVTTLRPRTVPADTVARTVERALTARRPRARYAAGVQARAMLTMGAVLPTRLGDAVGARVAGWR